MTRLDDINKEIAVFHSSQHMVYGPQQARDVTRYKLAMSNLLLATPLLVDEVKRLTAALNSMRDSLTNDWVEYDSAPPPDDPIARGYYDHFQEAMLAYRKWIERLLSEGEFAPPR